MRRSIGQAPPAQSNSERPACVAGPRTIRSSFAWRRPIRRRCAIATSSASSRSWPTSSGGRLKVEKFAESNRRPADLSGDARHRAAAGAALVADAWRRADAHGGACSICSVICCRRPPSPSGGDSDWVHADVHSDAQPRRGRGRDSVSTPRGSTSIATGAGWRRRKDGRCCGPPKR